MHGVEAVRLIFRSALGKCCKRSTQTLCPDNGSCVRQLVSNFAPALVLPSITPLRLGCLLGVRQKGTTPALLVDDRLSGCGVDDGICAADMCCFSCLGPMPTERLSAER